MAGGEVRMGQQGEEMGPVAMPEGQRVPVLPRRPASMTEVAAQHPGHVPCQIGCPRCLAEAWDYLKGDVEFVHTDEIDRRLEKKLKITQKERAGSSRLDVATAMGKPFKKKTLKGRNGRKSKSPPKVPIVIQDDSLPAGPPPQIRILKRPTTNGVLSNPNSASRPAFPVKSLAQREAEYAEARKRILGSASPEEEQEKPILDRPPRISQPEDTRQPNNVIRQPLGPDGSQGFKQRR
ncbi:SUZ domain-containing protein 1 isoform X1 [Aquila chrysaetos chrysaetos]|uniref:SUZ domain-containing protein 1 isoform X1 n=2 Tax=Aquila chrysaetos chrysaetos TaxID=223781 RepID=UPI0011769ED4|nr:SUZ domain-containing protein 1 isoform X1 [Aquila chrysaetos chrysaetos]